MDRDLRCHVWARVSILGGTLRTNGQVVTIIGVMPPDMRFPDDVDIWMPRAQLPLRTASLSTVHFQAIGRLADGVTLEQARVELASLSQRLAEAFPQTHANLTPYVWPYNEWTVDGGQFRLLFLLLQGAVPFVLLIACANVANLLLARSAHRAHEIAVRVALGASRRRVVRQLLVESVMLALIAGLAGWGVAVAGVRWADAAMQNVGMPYYMDFTMDGTVVVVMAAVCLATGVIFGLAPALHASKTDVNDVLQEGGRSGTGGLRARRWSSILMVTEIALTIVLLAGAGFMMRSFLTLYQMDLGAETSQLLNMQLYLPSSKYPDVDRQTELFRQFEERLAAVNQIQATTLTNRTLLQGGNPRRLQIDGGVVPGEEERATVQRLTVSDRYFETLGVELLRGRAFTLADGRPGQESVIVNLRFAAMHFPSEDPLGRRISLESEDGPSATREPTWLTIVGVSPDIRQRDPQDPGPDLVAYVPARSVLQRNWSLIVRTRGDPAAVATLVRNVMRSIDADLPIFNIQTMDQLLARQRWQFRVFNSMFTIFAVIALVLSAVGLYAVTTYSVTQRTRELGLRVALGARPGQVLWLVLRQVSIMFAVGLPIGLAGAVGVGRLLQVGPEVMRAQPLLLQTSPADPVTLLSIVAILTSVAILACLVPARRAARVDPMVALRHE
ncbi:MAG: ABC transporter permease [Acidobacteria bacterium]|nr:ABC transporter permease [Acidobacteriota bacterium]